MGTQGVRSLGGLRLPIIWWHTLDGSDRKPTFTGTSAPDRTGQTEMSDGPTPDDFRAKVFRDREHIGDWRVEKLLDDGESSEIAIFSGGDARQRAIRYADCEYGAFDEIELEPYNYQSR
jgi:hypothetical protein